MVAVIVAVLFLALLSSSLFLSRKARVEGTSPEGARPGPPAGKKGPKPMSRRDFFRRSLGVSLMIFGAQFGGASLAFLWPNLRGGFGSVIAVGKADDIKGQIAQQNQPFYFGAGKTWVVPYAGSGKDEAQGVDYTGEGAVADGLMALYQRCVHLGCRVPFCVQSQWFECPCHGSKYNKAGEYQLGPAPTGLQRFPITVDDSGNVMVDTSTILPGPPRGTDTIHENPQGPFCV
jgi:cytochrome b6-f complex iron-sulfur subunit